MTPADVLGDPVRLRAVAELGPGGLLGEDRFDRVTRTVLRVLDVPAARLVLVAEDDVVVVSAAGSGVLRRVERDHAPCSEVVTSGQPLLIGDTTRRARPAASPPVQHVGPRSYAGAPLRTASGHVVGALCGMDVRPRRWSADEAAALDDLSRWAEAELGRGDVERQRARGELAFERMKDELISVVSHELRTPVTALKGALGLLAAGVAGDLPPGGQDLARIAVTNADRLARLVEEICDLERLSAGQVVLERRPHRLRDLVARAVADVTAQAEQARVAVLPSVDDTTTWLDGERVRQAVQHLLENAVRASGPGTAVEVRARSTRDVLLLEVEDRGCGIAPDDLERVFGSFTRGDSSDTRAHGGTGLGLALARSVVEAHGGRLSARSTVGEGTTFTLTLPQRSSTRQGVA